MHHSCQQKSSRLQYGTSRWFPVRKLTARLLTFALFAVVCAPVVAQDATPTTTTVTSTRSYVLDGAIVVGLCGLAIFAVCRSSRRS